MYFLSLAEHSKLNLSPPLRSQLYSVPTSPRLMETGSCAAHREKEVSWFRRFALFARTAIEMGSGGRGTAAERSAEGREAPSIV